MIIQTNSLTRTIIFLDIDGVLNTRNHLRKQMKDTGSCSRYSWCPVAIQNLRRLYSKHNCKIVVSSSWRHELSIDELKKIFSDNGIDTDLVIGTTPSYARQIDQGNYCRGHEIAEWLMANAGSFDSYIILDDDAVMLPEQENRLVRTAMDEGFADMDRFLEATGIVMEQKKNEIH
jgi:hypothetical protein